MSHALLNTVDEIMDSILANDLRPLTFFGDRALVCGTYLLHICVRKGLWIRYGRFHQGQPIETPAGQYLYIGSALGRNGAASLPHRLLRHTTRAAALPHPIRQTVTDAFQMEAPAAKRLRWHVDYLVEETSVAIHHITIIQNRQRLESDIARILTNLPECRPLAPGLGATDDPGLSHILRLQNISIPQLHQQLPFMSRAK